MSRRLVITSGEPAGIGPDLIVQLAQQPWHDELVVLGDANVLHARARQLNLPLKVRDYDPQRPPAPSQAGEITLLHVPVNTPVTPGQLDPANAEYVLTLLERAGQGCLSGEFAAVVTGPIHKGVINEAGVPFSGHTEFFQAQAGVARVVMMLATEGLRVALATTHLPLREVADAITPERLESVLRITAHSLKTQFGIAEPHILVAGLNPHAGEGGHMGREEIEVIEPVLEALRREGLNLTGPLPADTLFTPHHLHHADAVLAMYHDQGLPVLKYKGFGRAVNITLGLPFVRTSVDHGTALDLAGSGQADAGSFHAAIGMAQRMAEHAP